MRWLRSTVPLYTFGLRSRAQLPVPVVVVGNVVAGGAGKTPVVMAVVRHLRARGLTVAVVSRGYGRGTTDCREVLPNSRANEVGDEPLLLRQAMGVPVFVAPLRADAARAALHCYPATQVIVGDDGLQHWALCRDVDICVFDERGTGNGWCLPAGPLREPWPRAVDLVVSHGPAPAGGDAPVFSGTRRLAAHARRGDGQQIALTELRGQPVHALAGIARPEAFFNLLTDAGLTLSDTEALPDHYDFESWTARKYVGPTLICTEKRRGEAVAAHPGGLGGTAGGRPAPGLLPAARCTARAKAIIGPWTHDSLNCWFARSPKARSITTATSKNWCHAPPGLPTRYATVSPSCLRTKPAP